MKNKLFTILLILPVLLLSQVDTDRLPYDYRAYPQKSEWKIAVFPIDFTDIPVNRRVDFPTKEEWQNIFFNGKIKEYYSQISYGNFIIKGDVFDYTTSSVVFWNSVTDEIAKSSDVLMSVNILAPGIDIKSYDIVYFIICHDAKLGQSVTTESTFILNGDTIKNHFGTVGYYNNGYENRDSVKWVLENNLSVKRQFLIVYDADSTDTDFVYHDMTDFIYTATHEIGHSLGIYGHANSSTNGDRFNYEPEVPNNENFLNKEYGNQFTLMGEGLYGSSMTGGFRDAIGIMDTSYIYSVNWYGTTTATVYPINRTKGKRYIEVLLPDKVMPILEVEEYKNEGYGLELREVDNLDTMLIHPALNGNTKGFFIYKIEGVANKLLDASPSANIVTPYETWVDLRDVVLKPGMTYENDDVKFTNVVENGDGSYSVDITIKSKKTITPTVDFTTSKRQSSSGEVELIWKNHCESCTSDQLLVLEYKNIDSVTWKPLTSVNLLAESFVTTTFAGKSGQFEFRGNISGNTTHTPSIKSLPISEGTILSKIDELDNSSMQFKMFQNSATKTYHISSHKAFSGEIKIINIKGSTVYSDVVQNKTNHIINLGLKDGVYFLYILQEDAKPIVRKLVMLN